MRANGNSLVVKTVLTAVVVGAAAVDRPVKSNDSKTFEILPIVK